MTSELRLDRTRAALAAWDAGVAERARRYLMAVNEDELAEAIAAEKKDVDSVREAFAADTADRNLRDRAFLVHPNDPWLRECVEKSTTALR